MQQLAGLPRGINRAEHLNHPHQSFIFIRAHTGLTAPGCCLGVEQESWADWEAAGLAQGQQPSF